MGRAYPTMLSMSLPFQVVNFVVYEQMKKWTNPKKEYKPWTHWLSGAVAGGTAAVCTMPLDVCKTLLNTQEANVLSRLQTTKVVGMRSALMTVYEYFKWFLQSSDGPGPNEDTIEDLKRDQEDSRFWDSTRSMSIVKELPRQVMAEGRVGSSDLRPERTLPGYRTRVTTVSRLL